MSTQVITKKSLLQYSFIAVPIAFAGVPLYLLAPDFYATHQGISLTALATILLAIRLFDAVQDPLIGWLTDKLQGRFMLMLSIAGSTLCLSVFGLFNISFFSPAIWFSLCMALAVSAYSMLTIIMGVQATLWTRDRNEQTRIASAREAFGLIGLVIAVSMPTLLSHLVNSDDIYKWYAVILFMLMLLGVISFSRLRDRPLVRITAKQNLSPLSAFRALPAESFYLFAVCSLSMLASSIPAVLVIFFVRDFLGAEHLTGLFLLLYFLSGAAAMPLWKNISTRIGKYKAWCMAHILAITGFIGAFYLNPGDIWFYGVVCVASGVALGADLTLPPSILSDHIHKRDNHIYSGSHYSFLALIGKVSLALASVIALPVLDAAGFKPQAVNSQGALATLSTVYALIPCLLKLVAAVFLYVFFIRSSGGNNENFQDHGNHRSSNHV
ncbi:MAG TPA: MFS transporter [Cellvibrio sp.]|nr:MFS transporter [Cellvibrio sp.]